MLQILKSYVYLTKLILFLVKTFQPLQAPHSLHPRVKISRFLHFFFHFHLQYATLSQHKLELKNKNVVVVLEKIFEKIEGTYGRTHCIICLIISLIPCEKSQTALT